MKRGINCKWSARHTLGEAVEAALKNFQFAPYLGRRGALAAEVHFNPAQLPPELVLFGLSVLPNADVPAGYIRVSTYDELDGWNELDAARAEMAGQVQSRAALAVARADRFVLSEAGQ